MATRRRFLKLATGGAGVYLTSKFGLWSRVLAQIPGGTLPPDVIPKFVTPLLIPPAMPLAGSSPTTDYYAIAVRQFAQQILPAPHRRTTVWGYGSLTDARTFNYPSYTIEATANRRAEVTWVNQLVDRNGRYLPHLLPVDQTLHWANPPGISPRPTTSQRASPRRAPGTTSSARSSQPFGGAPGIRALQSSCTRMISARRRSGITITRWG
jgi:spore coat protein A